MTRKLIGKRCLADSPGARQQPGVVQPAGSMGTGKHGTDFFMAQNVRAFERLQDAFQSVPTAGDFVFHSALLSAGDARRYFPVRFAALFAGAGFWVAGFRDAALAALPFFSLPASRFSVSCHNRLNTVCGLPAASITAQRSGSSLAISR